jgi:hypothetical protein
MAAFLLDRGADPGDEMGNLRESIFEIKRLEKKVPWYRI